MAAYNVFSVWTGFCNAQRHCGLSAGHPVWPDNNYAESPQLLFKFCLFSDHGDRKLLFSICVESLFPPTKIELIFRIAILKISFFVGHSDRVPVAGGRVAMYIQLPI